MNALGRMLAALRSPQAMAAVIAPESPRYSSPVWAGHFGAMPPDLHLTTDQQLAVSVAWACIRAIVDPIAASEIKVYQERDSKREEDRDGWLYWLLNVEPHPQYTSQGWLEVMGTRAVAKGNSYAHILRDGAARPYALTPLDPDRMRADDVGGRIVYLYQDPQNGELELDERDIIHIRGPRTGGFYGDSPLARASAALALARAQEEYATAYYANGAYPGILLVPPKPIGGVGSIPQQQKEEIRSIWRKLFGGPRRKGGVGTLDPGWDTKIIETDADKSQMVEARRAQVAEIARYFGVPGHLIGVPEASQGYGKNLAELGLGFVRQTLEPWSRRFSEEFRRKLMPVRRGSGSWFIDFDLSRLTRGDEESVARAEQIALGTGVLTINEARALRGLPSVKGGDLTLVNGKPLDQVIKPPPPPPAVEPATGEDEEGDEEERAAEMLSGHARRVKARTADLRKKGATAGEVSQHVHGLRSRARAELRRLLPSAEAVALSAAIESVEHGVEPEKAASTLVA